MSDKAWAPGMERDKRSRAILGGITMGGGVHFRPRDMRKKDAEVGLECGGWEARADIHKCFTR